MEANLGLKYIEYMDIPESERGITVNDFFEWCGVPMENRTDFAFAAILNQAKKIIGMNLA